MDETHTCSVNKVFSSSINHTGTISGVEWDLDGIYRGNSVRWWVDIDWVDVGWQDVLLIKEGSLCLYLASLTIYVVHLCIYPRFWHLCPDCITCLLRLKTVSAVWSQCFNRDACHSPSELLGIESQCGCCTQRDRRSTLTNHTRNPPENWHAVMVCFVTWAPCWAIAAL